MNILLANDSLDFRAGTETWVMTMLKHLSKIHNVDVFTTHSNTLTSASFDKSKHYHLALFNNNSFFMELRYWHIDVKIFTCHGIMGKLDTPIQGADAYVAISEETQDYMKGIGFKAHIIRNPIATDYFSYSPVHKALHNVLYLNNRPWKQDLLLNACSPFDLTIISRNNIDPLSAISSSDLVITAGRGCYESLSCGKNVIIWNRGLLDGMITRENIADLRKNNCSGRTHSVSCSVNELSAELSKYDPTRNLRPYIVENNEVSLIANKYLSLYETIRSIH